MKYYRKSKMELNEVYFWTSTIKDWKQLLNQDKYKKSIIEILQDLISRKLIILYGYVIMPNHVHFLWEAIAKNGKEMPHASFNKAIGHMIIKDLKNHHPLVLKHFEVNEKEREYRVWQRDALAIHIDSREKFEQKLEYTHLNPLQERWNICSRPENYQWSSAEYYETGRNKNNIISHYMDRF